MNHPSTRARIIITLFLCGFAFCCDTQAQGFLMWQAQRDGQTLHILANIPIMSADIASRLADEIDQAFRSSSLVIFESDPDPDRRKEKMKMIAAISRYPEGESLTRKLPRRVAVEFETFNRNMAIDSDGMDRLRPWMAAQKIIQIASIQSRIRMADDLEQMFYSRAVHDDKAISFLNSTEDTINLYSGMSEERQIQMLQKALRDSRSISNTMAAVENAWRAGDEATATRIITKNYSGYDGLHEELFTSRNETWAGKLDAHRGVEDHVFVLVNISHLVGPGSLLDQLRARGYLIAQIVKK